MPAGMCPQVRGELMTHLVGSLQEPTQERPLGMLSAHPLGQVIPDLACGEPVHTANKKKPKEQVMGTDIRRSWSGRYRFQPGHNTAVRMAVASTSVVRSAVPYLTLTFVTGRRHVGCCVVAAKSCSFITPVV